MSLTLTKYLNTLQFIASIKDKKVRSGVLKQYSSLKDFQKALREVAENTVKKNVPLDANQKKKLKPHRKALLEFLSNNKSKKLSRKKVIQSGGFLPILLPIILSLLTQ